MKSKLFSISSILSLALLLTACGTLWQVNPLPAGTALPSPLPNLASPTFTFAPMGATETPVPPTATAIPPTATAIPQTETATPRTLQVVAAPVIISLDMLDEQNGWATGATYLLRTTDGGATWLNATPPGITSVGYLTSFIMDAATAWFVLPAPDFVTGTLYHTTDGGLNWTARQVPFSGGSLQFLNAQAGWMLAALGAGAGSEAVAVFQTNDAGVTWNRVFINDPTVTGSSDSLPLSGQKSGMTFLDARHGWVTGSVPVDGFVYLYATQDNGVTWASQTVSLPSGFESAMTTADAPHFFSANEGIFHVYLYADVSGSVFYRTTDGGATWTPTFALNSTGRYAIADLQNAWIWDGGPAMYVSHDSGVTWSQVDTNLNVTDMLATFDFVNSATGWALTADANSHYTLYKTTDGGATWKVLIP
jgi:photosystem II stability/assembly factor-like uncharacterized protein